MRNFKRIFYAFTTILIVYMIYRMSILLLIVGLKGASRQLFFITLSLYLFIPLFKNIRFSNYNTEESETSRKIKKVFNSIKDNNITRLQGVTLKNENKAIDVDSIIINDKGVFNIVFCNYKGYIRIKEFNTWVKVNRRGGETEIESPINKIRQNREMLNKVFKEDEIIDLIVMVSDRADVEEEEVSSIPIIRYDDIVDYISKYKNDDRYNPEELYDKLYPLIFKTKDIDKDLDIYEKYLDNKWQYRSRFAIISCCFLFYIFKVLEVTT